MYGVYRAVSANEKHYATVCPLKDASSPDLCRRGVVKLVPGKGLAFNGPSDIRLRGGVRTSANLLIAFLSEAVCLDNGSIRASLIALFPKRRRAPPRRQLDEAAEEDDIDLEVTQPPAASSRRRSGRGSIFQAVNQSSSGASATANRVYASERLQFGTIS